MAIGTCTAVHQNFRSLDVRPDPAKSVSMNRRIGPLWPPWNRLPYGSY
jgi:hypothetical protein